MVTTMTVQIWIQSPITLPISLFGFHEVSTMNNPVVWDQYGSAAPSKLSDRIYRHVSDTLDIPQAQPLLGQQTIGPERYTWIRRDASTVTHL